MENCCLLFFSRNLPLCIVKKKRKECDEAKCTYVVTHISAGIVWLIRVNWKRISTKIPAKSTNKIINEPDKWGNGTLSMRHGHMSRQIYLHTLGSVCVSLNRISVKNVVHTIQTNPFFFVIRYKTVWDTTTGGWVSWMLVVQKCWFFLQMESESSDACHNF